MSPESRKDGADILRVDGTTFRSGFCPGPNTGGESWLGAGLKVSVADAQAQAAEAARAGESLYRAGRPDESMARFALAVQLQPDNARYHCWLGLSARYADRLELSQRHIREAIRLAPRDAAIHTLVSQWCLEMGRMEDALLHSARAVELAPHDTQLAIDRAWLLLNSGKSEAAWKLIEPMLTSGSICAKLAALFGRIAPTVGREQQAIALIESMLRSSQTDAYWTAALHMVAASLLDRAGRYAEAFAHVRLAKQIMRVPYDPQPYHRGIDAQLRYFTSDKLHSLPRSSHRSRRPVFIIGMPRSGTSLVEQILASHPQVHGAGELRTLGRFALLGEWAQWARGKPYPDYLDEMSVRRANDLAGEYLSNIAVLNPDKRYVVDKMPQNFLCLGLIAVLFPDCHVIHCRRNALDTCLSCYMTFFEGAQGYARDLATLGAFYRDYDRLMSHWKLVMHYPLIEVQYEELVSDLEGQSRRLLELLDLPWDQRCLQFHRNARAVNTASAQQVRQPIYSSSVNRWKKYERHLAPLIRAIQQPAACGPQTTFR
jgi:tetratricopeptide (TPR) repeat protein